VAASVGKRRLPAFAGDRRTTGPTRTSSPRVSFHRAGDRSRPPRSRVQSALKFGPRASFSSLARSRAALLHRHRVAHARLAPNGRRRCLRRRHLAEPAHPDAQITTGDTSPVPQQCVAWRAGGFAGATAPRRPASYFVFIAPALVAVFSTLRWAKDRGSDAGRRLPSVRGNPERPKAHDRGSDVGRHVAGPCVDSPRGRRGPSRGSDVGMAAATRAWNPR